MRTQLAAVHQPQFWKSAQPQDIATHYALAQQWEPFDGMARLSHEHMHDVIKDRYDLTPEQFLDGTQPHQILVREGPPSSSPPTLETLRALARRFSRCPHDALRPMASDEAEVHFQKSLADYGHYSADN